MEAGSLKGWVMRIDLANAIEQFEVAMIEIACTPTRAAAQCASAS